MERSKQNAVIVFVLGFMASVAILGIGVGCAKSSADMWAGRESKKASRLTTGTGYPMLVKEQFSGHTYIKREGLPDYFLHDPDCKCKP